MASRSALWSALLLVGGCAATDFGEEDSGRTVEIAQGEGFFIRLPRAAAGPRKAPEVLGALVRVLGRKVDEAANLEVFQFVAEGVGDAVIRIAGPDPSTPEFVIQVHVVPGGRPPSAPYGTQKPPGSY